METNKIYHSPLWLRYAIPVVTIGAALFARVALVDVFQGRYPMSLFIIPVIISTWYGGAWPGLLALVLGIAAGAALPPPYDLQITSVQGIERVALFAVVCGFGIFFITSLYKARHRAEINELRLQQEVREREEVESTLRNEMNIRAYAETALAQALLNAESASRAKTEFLANMSHEIRTPMNAVAGLANILLMTGPLTDRQREFISTLKLSADSLLALINDMLDIAKIEASSIELEIIPFNLRHLAEEVMNIMAVRAREKKISFTIEAARLSHAEYHGDPTRIRQIMMNLCGNAIKFTHSGTVTVVLEAASSGGDTDTVCIGVRDSGIGIPADRLATIFDKFVQGDSAINRHYGGSGLGLAITKNLAEVMGGEIEVASEYGQGSTFTVRIPLRRSASAAAFGALEDTDAAAAGASEPAQAKILVVEDHPANILVAGSFLEHFGFEYDVARSGTEALDKIEGNRYGAVLMDVQMPGLDGFETTRRIRENERGQGRARLPIIGVTAHALVGDREKCIESGMDDYIAKPFNPAELEHKLRHFARDGAPPAAPGVLLSGTGTEG